jgi:hypothetical protein
MMKHIIFILVFVIGPLHARAQVEQMVLCNLSDNRTGFAIPFARIAIGSSTTYSNEKGLFECRSGDSISISHPLYEPLSSVLTSSDSVLTLLLKRKEEELLKYSGVLLPEDFLKIFHREMALNDPLTIEHFETFSQSIVNIYSSSNTTNHSQKQFLRSYELTEMLKFKAPNNKYHKIIHSHFSSGDTSRISYIPINIYSDSPYEKFLYLEENYFLNPLHPDAQARYNYSLVDSIQDTDATIYVVYAFPKKKSFFGVEGLYYIESGRYAITAFSYSTLPEKLLQSRSNTSYRKLQSGRYFRRAIFGQTILTDIPKQGKTTIVELDVRVAEPSILSVDSAAERKNLDMVFFNKKDSVKAEEIWTMDKMIDPQKEELRYIRKDTSEGKYVLDDWIRLMVNVYEGKAALRLPLVDLNNVLSINQFEYLRLGLGVQTQRELSNRFTLGGYFGYGFRDNQIKYGGNIGLFIGTRRTSLLSYTYKKDLLEPGRIKYIERRPNYLRNFFAKEMDDIVSHSISFSGTITPALLTKLSLSAFELNPNYHYRYLLMPGDENVDNVFNFTEVTAQFRMATPFRSNKNLRDLIIGDRTFYPALFLNLNRGLKDFMGGEFNYWKLTALLEGDLNFKSRGTMDAAIETGIMTQNTPYQVLFNGHGSASSLVSIIVKNSFQTLPLYKYASDRFLNTYLKYSFPPWKFRKSKFRPELALATNMGWGILRGRKDLHISNDVSVKEYGQGYYEIGGIIDNLLRVKIYNYLYGGLGIGLFYGYGADDHENRFAVRVTYDIGSL